MKEDRRVLVLILLAALVLLGWTHATVFYSIVDKWQSDAAFSHGYLILPIVLWLGWRKRAGLGSVPFGPSWLGAGAAAVCTMLWVVAHGSGVLVIEQFAVVAMIPALVLAVLGWPATRVLIFPLAFLFFAVPFGRGIVPWLMQLTADLASAGLQWSGVPVLRSHMYISIPSGHFEVARACSGLKFFIAGLVLGVLYAHLTYRTWGKRLLCVAAFVIIPVLLNSVRVYVTIGVSHLTDMRFGPGAEHITFGMIFFIVVMLLMFWIGRRWQDEFPELAVARSAADARPLRRSIGVWMPPLLALLVLAAGPVFLESSITQARLRLAEAQTLVQMPAAVDGWRGPQQAAGRWRPQYHGGVIEHQALFTHVNGDALDVFVAVYGLGTTLGPEMISYGNVIDPQEHGSLAAETRVSVPLVNGDELVVRELTIRDDGVERLVWHWYLVGDRPVVSPFVAKALEAAAFVTRSADSERIVTLSTINDLGARERLQVFVRAHGECITAGFSGEACGG